MGAAAGQAERADDGDAGFQADAERQRRQFVVRRLGQQFAAGFEDGERGLQRAFGLRRRAVAAPDGEHRVALERFDESAVLFDDAGDHREEGVQHGGRFFGRARFAVGGEVAQVGEQRGDVAPVGVDRARGVLAGQRCGDRAGQVARQVGVKPVALEAVAGVRDQPLADGEKQQVERRRDPVEPQRVTHQQQRFDEAQRDDEQRGGAGEQRQRAARPADQGEQRGDAEQRGQRFVNPALARRCRQPGVERAAQQLGMHGEAGAAAAERRRDAVVEAERGTADQHPGVVEQSLRHAAGQQVGGGDADQRLRAGVPGNAHVALRVERQAAGGECRSGQSPGRGEQSAAGFQARCGTVEPLRQRGDEERRIDLAVGADQRRLAADDAVVFDERGDVADGQFGKGRGVGDVAACDRQVGRAGGPVEGAGRLAAGRLGVVFKREDLGEQRVVLAQAGEQLRVAGRRRRQDQVEYLQRRAFAGQAIAQLRQARARPGPAAQLAQAGLVDVDQDDAPFAAVAGGDAPDPVARILFGGPPAGRESGQQRGAQREREQQRGQRATRGRVEVGGGAKSEGQLFPPECQTADRAVGHGLVEEVAGLQAVGAERAGHRLVGAAAGENPC